MEQDYLKNKNFEKIFIKSVDLALSSLGKSGKHAIYYYLQNNYNIKRASLFRKIEEFSSSIDAIFGLGGKFLQILILKNLDEKMKLDCENYLDQKNFSFLENVKRKKECMLKEKN